MVMPRSIRDFSLRLIYMEKEYHSSSIMRNILGRARNGLTQGTWGVVTSDLENAS